MLKIQEIDNPKHEMWLVKPSITVGSATECDFILDSKHIADVHLKLNKQQDHINLTNLSNLKTPLVNNMPVRQYGPLKHGDIIKIADKELAIVDPKAKSAITRAGEGLQTVLHPAPAKKDWALIAECDWLAGQSFAISDGVILGRDGKCDITIAGTHLSRRHVKFRIVSEGLEVTDLNSANGTFVNGKRIRQTRLLPGDELRIDVLKFRIDGPRSAQTGQDQTVIRPALVHSAPNKTSANPSPVTPLSNTGEKQWKTKPTSVGNRPEAELSYLNPQQHKDNWLLYSLLGVLLLVSALVLWTQP